MSVNGVHQAAAVGDGAAHAPGHDEAGLLASAEGWWADVRGIAHEHLQLVALEAQRASRGLVWLLVHGILVSVLLLGAWAGTLAALVLWLIASGVGASAALLLAASMNLVAAGLLAQAMRRSSRRLGFAATLRSLQRRDVAAAPL
jgi:uncharacterized membrane protein YqjE